MKLIINKRDETINGIKVLPSADELVDNTPTGNISRSKALNAIRSDLPSDMDTQLNNRREQK
jgi:hypothetical protein